MHITQRLQAGLPSLRRGWVRELFRSLLNGAAERGVRTVAFAILGNHIHWVVVPRTRAALGDAARYVFAGLARGLNKAWQRRGRVFSERFYSRVGRSVRDAFHLINYVLRNPVAAGISVARNAIDPFVGANVPFIDRHPFLRTVLGTNGPTLQALLLQMTRDRIPFIPLSTRLQVPLL